MVVLYARRHDWNVGEVSVDVNYDADVTPRAVEVTLHLPEGLATEQTERLRRVADTCPVRRALQAGFTFDERIEHDLRAAALR